MSDKNGTMTMYILMGFILSIISMYFKFNKSSGPIFDSDQGTGCFGKGKDCDKKGKTVRVFISMASFLAGLCLLLTFVGDNFLQKFMIKQLKVDLTCCASIVAATLFSLIAFSVAVLDAKSEDKKDWSVGFYTLLFSTIAYSLAAFSGSCKVYDMFDLICMVLKKPNKYI